MQVAVVVYDGVFDSGLAAILDVLSFFALKPGARVDSDSYAPHFSDLEPNGILVLLRHKCFPLVANHQRCPWAGA